MGLPRFGDTAEGAVGEVESPVLIDCDACAVRDLQCGDCVMTVLLGPTAWADPDRPGVYDVDPQEAMALEALADSGLVPHLRLVPLGRPDDPGRASSAAS